MVVLDTRLLMNFSGRNMWTQLNCKGLHHSVSLSISCRAGGINDLLSTQQGQEVGNGSLIIQMRYCHKIHCYQKCYWKQRRNESTAEVLWGEDVKFRFACIEQGATADIHEHVCRSDLFG